MTLYKPRTRKCVKDIDFYHLLENIKKKLLDTGLDSLKTASKKVTHQIDPF